MVPPLFGEVSTTAVELPPLQTTWFVIWSTVAVGSTVMVKLRGVPTHETPPLVKVGVTVILATTGLVPLLLAANEAILLVPLAARLIDVLSLVQAYERVPPVFGEVKLTARFPPSQTVWLLTVTVAVGFTVIVNVSGVPVQLIPPFAKVGVTVMVATNGVKPELVALNDGMPEPDPDAASPIPVSLFDQL